jgi:hypothetical protein
LHFNKYFERTAIVVSGGIDLAKWNCSSLGAAQGEGGEPRTTRPSLAHASCTDGTCLSLIISVKFSENISMMYAEIVANFN